MPLRRLLSIATVFAGCVLLGACATQPRTAEPIPQRTVEQRVTDTEEVLLEYLAPEAALAEAERLVALCEASAEELFGTYFLHPGDGRVFDSIEEAEEASQLQGSAINVGRQACTAANYQYVQDLSNV